MSSKLFNPQRLTLARQKRKLTKTGLAGLAGVTTRSISAYENGATVPTSETIVSIAACLKFPVEFFFAAAIDRPELGAVSFRSLSSMTAGQRDSALAAGTLAIELASWIDKHFILPECDLEDFRAYSPETAAASIRTLWHLGQKPIKNSIHLLEAHGVRVFSLAEDGREVDAFSFWHGSTAFVFLNTLKSAEHSRFDAMHELGHLVMHRHGGPDGRVAEQEADAFASAMLMPRDDVLAHSPRFVSLPVLLQIKKRWAVSLSAINYRLHNIGLTTDWQYRTLCIQISEKGYRLNEPEPCERETSQILEKVLTALKVQGLTWANVADELNVRGEDLDALVFGLVLTALMGNRKDEGQGLSNRKHLRIVANND